VYDVSKYTFEDNVLPGGDKFIKRLNGWNNKELKGINNQSFLMDASPGSYNCGSDIGSGSYKANQAPSLGIKFYNGTEYIFKFNGRYW
jgi:hypothetical protein